MQRHHIRLRQRLFEIPRRDMPIGCYARRMVKRVMHHDLHVKGPRIGRNARPDPTIPHHQRGLAGQIHHARPILGPPAALLDVGIRIHRTARHTQHQHHGVFGDRKIIGAIHHHHGDAAFGAGRNIHRVKPNPDA